jgi:hypothetical protein
MPETWISLQDSSIEFEKKYFEISERAGSSSAGSEFTE